ncbi:MAG TPA: hypothetical protein VI299_26950 [Polyangiales bacterium]
MNNTLKVMCVFGVLASLVACGDDDGGDNPVDSSVVTPIDAGRPDSSVNMDAQVAPNDSGTTPMTGDCVSATPTKFVDFLNRCSSSNVVTVTKPTLGIPAALLDSNGNVLPL